MSHDFYRKNMIISNPLKEDNKDNKTSALHDVIADEFDKNE